MPGRVNPPGDRPASTTGSRRPGSSADGKSGLCVEPAGLSASPPGLLDMVASYLFPRRCLFCREVLPTSNRYPLCPACLQYYKPGGRICPWCEGFFRERASCSCPVEEMPLRGLFVIALYDSRWRRLIHDLKYRNRRAVIAPLAAWLAGEITAHAYCAPDLIVPVPLHPARERERGYNQAALLARHIARFLKTPARNLLIKDKQTRSQTSISRRERQENVRGAFRCLPGDYAGMTILLVDDVYSTGSTMKEAASVLCSTGAVVYGAAVAYNPYTRVLQGTGFYGGLDKW